MTILRRLRDELPNIRVALEHCIAQHELDRGLAMAVELSQTRLWFYGGTLTEGGRWLRRLLAHPESARVDSTRRAEASAYAAFIALCQGNSEAADAMLEQAKVEVRQARDRSATAAVDFARGVREMLAGAPDRSMTILSQACEDTPTDEDGGGRRSMARLLWAMDCALHAEPDAALRQTTTALHDGIAECGDAVWVRTWMAWPVAVAELRSGDPLGAVARLRAALDDGGGLLDDAWGPPWFVEAMGWALAAAHHCRAAARMLGGANRLQQIVGASITGLGGFCTLHEKAVVACRTALGEREYDSAYAQGAERSVESILRMASSRHGSEASAEPGPAGMLTPRQRDVAALIAKGLGNHAIAQALTISLRTVESHTSQIRALWGLSPSVGRDGFRQHAQRYLATGGE